MTKKGFFILIIFIFSLLILPISLQAQKGFIRDVRIKTIKGGYSVSFYVEDCFTEKIEEAIKAGIPTTFNFYIKLYQKRWWKDKEIASCEFSHVIKFYPVQKEFHIKLGENRNSYTTSNFEEAKRIMATVKDVEIRHPITINSEGPAELRIKVELDPMKLPFPLEYLSFLISLWDFETDWHIESIPF